MASPNIIVEETNLEDLLILGDDKLISVIIEYPTDDGRQVKAKALVKQLTLKELSNIKPNSDDLLDVNMALLGKTLFTNKREPFTKEMISALPMGVVYALSSKIMELSGVNVDNNKRLMDF